MPTPISSAALARRRSTPNPRADFPTSAVFAVVALLLAVGTLHFERQRFAEGGATRPEAAASQADLGSVLP
jgi:hypothetical protein